MKKKLFGILIAVIMLFFIAGEESVYAAEIPAEEAAEEEPQPDTELIFNPDSVIHKTAAKSALADMHGVFVFRNAFITQEALVKERDKKVLETIETTVLINEQPDLGYREWVDLILMADTEKYIKDVYIEEKENTLFIWIYCIILSICFLCAAIRIEAFLKKRKQGRDKQLSYEIKGILICFLGISLSFCTACSKEKTNMECVLELEEEKTLWIEKPDESDSIGECRLYIRHGEEMQLLVSDALKLKEDDVMVWEYEDINEDGRKDIVVTTQAAIWVLVQDEEGNYAVWEEEPMQPVFKKA